MDTPAVPTALPDLTRGSSSLRTRGLGCYHPAENQGSHSKLCPESFQVLSILASLSQMPPRRHTFLSTKQNCHYPCFGTKPRFSGYNSSRKAVFGHFPHVALEIPPVPFGMGLRYFHGIVSLPHPPRRASLTCSTSWASSSRFLHLP